MKQVHITEEQLKILKEMKGKRLVDICRATNINYKTLWKWRHYYKKI
jgi:transposase-like protein